MSVEAGILAAFSVSFGAVTRQGDDDNFVQSRKLPEMRGDLQAVGLDDLRQLLGADAAQDFENLRQMMALLQGSGYLMNREGQTALSPKGTT